ncbi:MAG: BON domain-containing protein [Holosporaceae bacterium]|jgi:osmotically-inducible protein OsmY|nr:BON domain-containing protein [Holosporaceae bacterium]
MALNMRIIDCIALSILLLCGACNPVVWIVGGSAAAVGGTAVRNKKGISGSLSDTQLQLKVNRALFQEDNVLCDKVELAVKHGMVVVIGYVSNESQRDKIIQVVDGIADIKHVFYEIDVRKRPTISERAKDSGITSRVKSALLFDGNISSLNYDITTVKSIVYICGTASSKYERDVVINHARTTSGASKVVAYIKLQDRTIREKS